MAEYAKEFPLRLTAEQVQELEKVMQQTGHISNQSQVIRYVLMNHRRLERELGNYKMELAKVVKELDTLKRALRQKSEAENAITQILRT